MIKSNFRKSLRFNTNTSSIQFRTIVFQKIKCFSKSLILTPWKKSPSVKENKKMSQSVNELDS